MWLTNSKCPWSSLKSTMVINIVIMISSVYMTVKSLITQSSWSSSFLKHQYIYTLSRSQAKSFSSNNSNWLPCPTISHLSPFLSLIFCSHHFCGGNRTWKLKQKTEDYIEIKLEKNGFEIECNQLSIPKMPFICSTTCCQPQISQVFHGFYSSLWLQVISLPFLLPFL